MSKIDALKIMFNTNRENLDKFYGMIDFENKRVIDIGAEVGTSANYFLQKGAREVYAYEANPILFARLAANFMRDMRVHPLEKWTGSALPDADVLKMDCEGCEYMLTEWQLQQFRQWAIGVHRPRKNMPKVLAMQRMLEKNGGKLIANMGFEILYVKI